MRILRRLLFWTIALVFPLPLVITYWMVAQEPNQLKFDISLGLVAYAWWLLAIALSLRPVWIDRLVGLPALYGLHGMLGFGAVILAQLHRDSAYAGDRLAQLLGDWSFYLSLGVLLYSVFFLSGWVVDRIRFLLLTRRWAEKVFRHQVSMWLHRLNLVIVGMIWLHAHLLVRVNQHFWFMTLFDVYTVGVLGCYAWKKWIGPDHYPTGVVTANDALGESIRRLRVRLDQPADRLEPGGFFFLRAEGTPVVGREWHPFSVTDDDRAYLTFTIRQNGDYTRRLTGLTTGTAVRLEGPFGRFDSAVRRQDAHAPLALIGMGAGIAPLLSLAAAHHDARPIHVLWAVRNPSEAYYRDLLDDCRASSGGLMTVSIQVGRFRPEQLEQLLDQPTIRHGAFFVVGPSPGVLGMQRLLRRLGVARRQIHHERLM